MELNRNEMLELARKHFGDNVDVEWDGYRQCWNILTEIEERFDINDHVDTAFYEEFVKDGKLDHYEWERWTWKNGVSGMSSTEQVSEYNSTREEISDRYVARVIIYRHTLGDFETSKIVQDFQEIDDYAEKRGITLESARSMYDSSLGHSLGEFEKNLIARRDAGELGS